MSRFASFRPECAVRDVLYGDIGLTTLESKIVWTPEFQSLRAVKQLGMAAYVFPSATHTRYEHCIGTCHLAGKLLENTPAEPRIVQLVRVAALVHDIGHVVMSHGFDHWIAPHMGETLPVELRRHEDRGCALFEWMNRSYDLGLAAPDLAIVRKLIHGHGGTSAETKTETKGETKDETASPGGGGGGEVPEWIYDIVSHPAMDVDKLDYLARDSYALGVDRGALSTMVLSCLSTVRVCPAHGRPGELRLAFHVSTAHHLQDILMRRAQFHHAYYQHPATISVTQMFADAGVIISVDMNWASFFKDAHHAHTSHTWRLELSDSVFDKFESKYRNVDPATLSPTVTRALSLLKRIARRQWYDTETHARLEGAGDDGVCRLIKSLTYAFSGDERVNPFQLVTCWEYDAKKDCVETRALADCSLLFLTDAHLSETRHITLDRT